VLFTTYQTDYTAFRTRILITDATVGANVLQSYARPALLIFIFLLPSLVPRRKTVAFVPTPNVFSRFIELTYRADSSRPSKVVENTGICFLDYHSIALSQDVAPASISLY